MLEGGDRFWKLLELRAGRSQEVPGVGVVRIDFSNATEGIDGQPGARRVLVIEAEAVPGVRVFGIVFDGLFQQRLRFGAACPTASPPVPAAGGAPPPHRARPPPPPGGGAPPRAHKIQ